MAVRTVGIGKQYLLIGDAVKAAAAGDTINVMPTTSTGTISSLSTKA